jgi:hypothetical protein
MMELAASEFEERVYDDDVGQRPDHANGTLSRDFIDDALSGGTVVRSNGA